jgi:hypothetical protein
VLGSRGNQGWLDLSDYIVHFTKGGDDKGYETIMSVLGQQRLARGPTAFGAATRVAEVAESQRVVCFSEVPVGFLERISIRRKSKYGVGFTKRFLLDRGGAPLWYLEHGTAQQQALSLMIDEARRRGVNPEDPVWSLTPFVDFPSGPSSPYTYDFRWEREWRVAADVHFEVDDVGFLLIPEENHGPARSFFADAVAEDTGPGYFCPYIDPLWSLERVQQALREQNRRP